LGYGKQWRPEVIQMLEDCLSKDETPKDAFYVLELFRNSVKDIIEKTEVAISLHTSKAIQPT